MLPLYRPTVLQGAAQYTDYRVFPYEHDYPPSIIHKQDKGRRPPAPGAAREGG
jgi:hypothetical protein